MAAKVHTEVIQKAQEQVEVDYVFCEAPGCEAKLVVWTTNMKDHLGQPVPRTEPLHMSLCSGHGFDKLMGRAFR